MKKPIYIIFAVIAITLSMLLLTGCGSKQEEPTEPTKATTQATTEKVLTNQNLLTGLDNLSDEAIGKRPVAIMINNISASLPQYGIYDADIMYEALVEGGITRMMAIFADYTKVPDVCSVRSCRYYYPIFANGYDAVYFCFGSNASLGTATLKRIGIDYFNGAENMDELIFGRDPNRVGRYATEHTAYVKGANLPKLLDKYDVRTDLKKSKQDTVFNFVKPKAQSDTPCTKAVLAFSDSYYSTFTYDSTAKKYLKQHSGDAHMDSAVNKQLAYTNVFVLQTKVSLYEGGPLVQMAWKGGTGYYISYGVVEKIKWRKESEDENIKIFDANGKEIKVNKGNSYIGVINYDQTTLS